MRFPAVIVVVLLARVATAQTSDSTRRAPSATISGVVHDSIAHAPLAGAIVQLVSADTFARFGRSATSDSLGRFALSGIPNGRYRLGFIHPMLDSIGLEPILHAVAIEDQTSVRVDLAIPSAARLRTVVCGSPAAALVMGVVRDARTSAPLVGATVVGEWLELTLKREGLERHSPRLVATTPSTGGFALCGVPSAGTLAVMAAHGADSTDRIDLEMPSDGFLRRDLYVGRSNTLASRDSTSTSDTTAGRMRTGDGRLSGTVIAASGGRPLRGAQVSIANGPRGQTNEVGDWTLVDAPAGTRMLEIRAIGYFPERRAVDLIPGTASIQTSLLTMKAVLDTVRVTASRLAAQNKAGFEERRRSGLGQYITAEEMERSQAIVTSQVFRTVLGVTLEPNDSAGAGPRLQMRGPFGTCDPAVYIDGHYMYALPASEIDDVVSPDEVLGIEIYTGAGVPPQFSTGMFGARRPGDASAQVCGSIAIWTKPNHVLSPWTKRRAVGMVAAGVAFGFLVKAFVR